MVMKKWLKDITGVSAKEEAIAKKEKEVKDEEMKLLKKKDPKAYATSKKESWVNVLDMKVNKDNIRNGFFELDWNEYFIVELKQNGYGVDGDPEEQIVDRWFRDIVYGMLEEQGQSTDVGAGYINVVPLDKDKSEIS
jgi:hypothetical protein|tara:strand:- start:311 stop:721 length:411 start_codon:yes stop_codon:yes gene_type:complete